MGTYNHKQIITDYANGRITAEMAVGHSLQHIDKLYEAQTAINTSHRELRARVSGLESELKSLRAEVDHLQKRQAETDRLQTLENKLTALNVTVYKMKDYVDHLQARLSNAGEGDPSTSSGQVPSARN
jgi:chromosome segregation ATPase